MTFRGSTCIGCVLFATPVASGHATLATKRTLLLNLGQTFTGWIAPALRLADAVGTRVTSRPPHRTVLAAFPHTVPTSGTDNQALRLDVCWPASANTTRTRFCARCVRAGSHSPWPLPFAPPTPPQQSASILLCSPVSLLL
jgi:hypothetical protein